MNIYALLADNQVRECDPEDATDFDTACRNASELVTKMDNVKMVIVEK